MQFELLIGWEWAGWGQNAAATTAANVLDENEYENGWSWCNDADGLVWCHAKWLMMLCWMMKPMMWWSGWGMMCQFGGMIEEKMSVVMLCVCDEKRDVFGECVCVRKTGRRRKRSRVCVVVCKKGKVCRRVVGRQPRWRGNEKSLMKVLDDEWCGCVEWKMWQLVGWVMNDWMLIGNSRRTYGMMGMMRTRNRAMCWPS